MDYSELKATLKAKRDSDATCFNCRNANCPELGRHSPDSPGLPCENHLARCTPETCANLSAGCDQDNAPWCGTLPDDDVYDPSRVDGSHFVK